MACYTTIGQQPAADAAAAPLAQPSAHTGPSAAARGRPTCGDPSRLTYAMCERDGYVHLFIRASGKSDLALIWTGYGFEVEVRVAAWNSERLNEFLKSGVCTGNKQGFTEHDSFTDGRCLSTGPIRLPGRRPLNWATFPQTGGSMSKEQLICARLARSFAAESEFHLCLPLAPETAPAALPLPIAPAAQPQRAPTTVSPSPGGSGGESAGALSLVGTPNHGETSAQLWSQIGCSALSPDTLPGASPC